MTKDRAITLVRKLQALAAKAGSEGEAAAAREQASKLMAKFEITSADLREPDPETVGGPRRAGASSATSLEIEEVNAYLVEFERTMRVALLVEGRKRGRFADHPHVDKILAAAAKRRSR